ncbi:hypothetical protein GS491_23715 [Rhodococcus hoagii]|nr:hypothetical protein [Prescottella equi]
MNATPGAVEAARRLLATGHSCILDCESTGLDGSIVEIAVIAADTGAVLFDELVNPDGVASKLRLAPSTASATKTSPEPAPGPRYFPTWSMRSDRAASSRTRQSLIVHELFTTASDWDRRCHRSE